MQLKTLRKILTVLLVLTSVAFVIQGILEWLNPGYFGFFFNFIISIVLIIPVYVAELELYGVIKYFFVDAEPVKEKIVCKLLCAVFTLIIVINYCLAVFREGFSLFAVWLMTISLAFVHLAEFIIARRVREQAAWIKEMTEGSSSEQK